MAQDLIVNGVTYPAVEAMEMTTAAGEKVVFYPDAVRYNAQTLTDEQKAQARENIGAAASGTIKMADAICPPNQLAADGSLFGDYNEETEELYTGPGCHPGSDFNWETISYNEMVTYMDKIIADHPNYIHRESMGLDESGTYPWYRYILSQCPNRAWQKQNYPKMYAWANGTTRIYSLSVSPRPGDTMYSTPYVGTAYGTVDTGGVDSSNQARIVGGVSFSRAKASDVEPTLLYTNYYTLAYVNGNTGMYAADTGALVVTLNNQKANILSAATADGVPFATKRNEVMAAGSLTDDNGVVWLRYPMGDRMGDWSIPIKVFVGGNEHGASEPAEPAICCVRMVKDLAEGTDNPMLNYLRKSTIIIAVPMLNPWGCSQYTVSNPLSVYGRNANGININRNYDTPGWSPDADTGPCGEYAGSENETQYIMNSISLCDVAVSYHSLGGKESTSQQQICAYQFNGYLKQNPNAQTTVKETAAKNAQIASVMLRRFGWNFVPYNEAPPATMAKSPAYITHAGCTGGLIEMSAMYGASGEESFGYFTPLCMEANYSLMLMTLYSFIHDFDKTVRI